MAGTRHDPFDVACAHRFLHALPQLKIHAEALDLAAVDRSLSEPEVEEDEQLGELRRYTTPWGNLYVSRRRHVVRFLSKQKKRGDPEIDLSQAGQAAQDFMRALTEDIASRNFVAGDPDERFDLFKFSWEEHRRPGECSLFPNSVVVKITPRKGYVASYYGSDVRSYRSDLPPCADARARQIIAELYPGTPHSIEHLDLTERSIHGGLRTRTVYDARVMTTGGGPSGIATHAIVLDAENGDVLEHVR